MGSRPTIKDIARLAGVGSATVDRVLNGRGGVSEETTARILQIVKRHGYGRRPTTTRHGVLRIEVIMVRPDSPFFIRLNKAFERLAAMVDSTIAIHRTFLPENDPLKVAHHIANPAFRRAALIIVAPGHPDVARCLQAVADAGVHVVQIVTRHYDAFAYIGIDNYAAGRTAAFLMTAMLGSAPGKLLALCHSGVYEVHRQRIRGFSDFIAERPLIAQTFHSILLGHDEEVRSAEVLSAALASSPDVVGLYNAGGCNPAVAAVLRRKDRHILWIGHELEDETRAYLKSGLMTVVIDQSPEVQARRARDLVLGRLGLMDEVEPPSRQVTFLTLVAESI